MTSAKKPLNVAVLRMTCEACGRYCTDEPSVYVVGTHNSNGEEYVVCPTYEVALVVIEQYLRDGFTMEEIICIEGVRREISCNVGIKVSDLIIRRPA